MDRLEAMKAFLAVAQRGGFAPAARELGISTSAMSRHISSLESWLDVQLFHRTTRQISLTPAGDEHLKRFQKIVDEVSNLEAKARGISVHPSGEVRLTTPRFFTQRFLGSALESFLAAQPDVHIRLYIMDRVVNLIEEGFDLAIRIGHLEDSSLIARRIGSMRVVVIAAPDYLKAHGKPEKMEDLKGHNCIVDTTPRHGNRWPFTNAKSRKHIEVSGNLFANDGNMVRQLTLDGHGVSLLPDFFVSDDIKAGHLVPLLSEFITEEAGIYLVYQREQHRSAAVQALIDWFIAEITPRHV